MHAQEEKEEFLKLIAENQGIILKICHAYCNNQPDREDLAQEIVYTLWKGRKTFNPDFKFSTWLYRVALNVAISIYRSTKKAPPKISIQSTDMEIEDKMGVHPGEDDNSKSLQHQISILNEFDRALMILYFEERSHKEIAEILGISQTNVATKINRIKERMKQNILSEKN